MKIENLKALRRSRPFRQFTLFTASGESYLVTHPELIMFVPDESVAIIASAPSTVSLVDVDSISDVSFDAANRPLIGGDDADNLDDSL